jgi:PEP-CTERM motif
MDLRKVLTAATLRTAFALAATGAHAASLLTVSSYAMPNGDGQAHSGSYNYWDATYSNCVASNCTTDGLSGSNLSGGLGKLTDGVIATQPWYDVSNDAGTGQYVGWLQSPTIDFNFAGSVTVGEIKLYVDNSHIGGVTAPDSVVVDGTTYLNPAWASASAPQIIDITGLHLTGGSVTVTLHDPTYWVFLSEAQFYSTTVPEPSTWIMMTLGFAGLGFAAIRARRGGAAAWVA